MRFHEKLRKAMQELNINQVQVAGSIGKSTASVSNYVKGTQTPSWEEQRNIALSLGLKPDYFEEDDEPILKLVHRGKAEAIDRLLPVEAAKFLSMDAKTVRIGLQQGVFPWGYAIKTSENHWTYFINAKRFAEIEGVII